MRLPLLFVVVLVGCTSGKKEEPTGAVPPVPAAAPATTSAALTPNPSDSAAMAEAKTVFTQRCSLCHGMSGTGDGPASATLNPKPRNYTDPAWQASIKDDEIKKIVLEGGPAVGKSIMMPAQVDLKDKPEVMNELVKIVRSFAKK